MGYLDTRAFGHDATEATQLTLAVIYVFVLLVILIPVIGAYCLYRLFRFFVGIGADESGQDAGADADNSNNLMSSMGPRDWTPSL